MTFVVFMIDFYGFKFTEYLFDYLSCFRYYMYLGVLVVLTRRPSIFTIYLQPVLGVKCWNVVYAIKPVAVE